MERQFQTNENFDVFGDSCKKPRIEDKPKNTCDDEIPNKNDDPFHFVALQDLPPLDAALSIEEIQKQIFSNLSTQDLVACRLVCHFWNTFATKQLIERPSEFEICFSYERERKQYICFRNKQSLSNLTHLLDKTRQDQFPCSSFEFFNINLAQQNPDLQSFLSMQGYRVERLKLNVEYTTDANSNSENSLLALSAFVEFVENLLLEQTPNIHFLEIGLRTFAAPEIEKDYIHKRHTDKRNLNLRVVEITGYDAPQPLFDCVCHLAPNLEQLNLSERKYNYYYEHGNRLHLLDKLWYYPGYDEDLDEQFSTIVNIEGKLQLKWLHLNFDMVFKQPQLWDKVAHVLTRLLEKSCDSLETLFWSRMRFLKETKIPRLPNVKDLIFMDQCYGAFADAHFFPEDMRMTQTFPNLHTIRIKDHCLDEFRNPDNFLRDKDDEAVTSVKVVQTWDLVGDDNLYKTWFPNAKINGF